MNNELRAVVVSQLQRVAPEIEAGDLGDDDSLRDDLGIDSFDFLRMMQGIFEQTGVNVPEADYGKLDTVAGAVRYLAEKTAQTG